jgi:hypothetical protein
VVVVLLCRSSKQQGLLRAALNNCTFWTDEEKKHVPSQYTSSSAKQRKPIKKGEIEHNWSDNIHELQ